MSDIRNFFGGRRQNIVDAVQRRKDTATTKTEQRKLEMAYLKPDGLKPYTGHQPDVGELARLTVKLVFPNLDTLDAFKRHFKVAEYIEPSVTNIEVLLAIVDEMDEGNISYDKETSTITYR